MLRQGIRTALDVAPSIVVACCVLQNFLETRGVPVIELEGDPSPEPRDIDDPPYQANDDGQNLPAEARQARKREGENRRQFLVDRFF